MNVYIGTYRENILQAYRLINIKCTYITDFMNRLMCDISLKENTVPAFMGNLLPIRFYSNISAENRRCENKTFPLNSKIKINSKKSSYSK